MIIQYAENFLDKNFSDRVSNFLAKSSFLEYLDRTEHMFTNQKRRKFHSTTTEDGNASKSAAPSNTKKC